ncbi:hypothetical protein CROQUDRAFT_713616 [Cronartium quercuum f. sp. fusiforme G11]|uniref:Uncharacterized protein n=1 Tax=Cronartium quercuum f. sp. fusiforme G11 TaxID=708437 RepID=A0A9P6NN09_9BASI|nr:hypothetical protein CROQUDRAFT_713616 [Cronartium quercuum f. sp. fusiforme G11]
MSYIHSNHSSKSIQEQQPHRKGRVHIRRKRPNSISISNSILNSNSFIKTNFNQFKPSNSNHMISSLNQVESDIPYSSYLPSSTSTSAQKLSVDCSTITTESNEQDEIDSGCSSLDVASFLASVHSAVSKVRTINQYHQQSIRLEGSISPLMIDQTESNSSKDRNSNSQITTSNPITTNHQKSLSTGSLPSEFKTSPKITRGQSSSSSTRQTNPTILSNHSITPEKPKNEFDMKLEILQRAIDTGNFDNLDMPSLIKWEDESDHDETEITLSNDTSNEPLGRIPGTPITLTSSIVYSSTPFTLNQTSTKTLLSNGIDLSRKSSSNSINGGEGKFGLDIQTIKKTLHTPLLSDTLLDDSEELSFDQQEDHPTEFHLPKPPSSSNTSQTDLNRSRSQTNLSHPVSTRNLNNPVDSRLAESRSIPTNLKLEQASLFQPVNNKLSLNSRNENQQVFLTKSPYHDSLDSPIESILTQPHAPTSPISSSIPIVRQDSFSSFNKSSINYTASIRSTTSTFSSKLKTFGKKLGFNEAPNQIPDNGFVSRNGRSFEHNRIDRSMNGGLHHRISAQTSRSVISSQHTLNQSYNEMVPRNNRQNSTTSSQNNQTRISIEHLSNDFDSEEQVENLKETVEKNQSSTLFKNEVEKDFIKNQKTNADKNRLNQILLNHQALEKQYMKELTCKSKAKIKASTNNNNRE